MFKRTLIASLLVTAPVFAADDFGSNPPLQELRRGIDWSGAYVGLNLGALRGTGRAERGNVAGVLLPFDAANNLFPGEIDSPDHSLTGGVAVGYNQQYGNFVAGVELDASWVGIEARTGLSKPDTNPNPPFAGVQTVTDYETNIDYVGTARVRLGVAAGDTLIFATGGIAAGEVENRFSLAIPSAPFFYTSPDWSKSGVEYGYAVGVGLEHKITENLSLKAEVQHIDLSDVTVLGEDPPAFPGESIEYTFDNAFTIARVGINYAF